MSESTPRTTAERPVPGPRCIPGIMDDLVGALRSLDIDPETSEAVIDESLRYVQAEFGKRLVPSTYITGVHRILKEKTGIEVPFAELRDKCNRVGIEIAGRVAEEAKGKEGYERFRFLAMWAMAGNDLDFRTVGTGYDFDTARIESDLRGLFDAGLTVDRLADIYEAFRGIDRLLYIPDNVGEIAFDRLLVEEIKSWGVTVTVPYRGGPITSDATLEDFQAVGLDEAASAIFCAGPDTLGISLEEASPELKEALASHDHILTKGQANYYVVLRHGKELGGLVASLLTTKCDLVAGTFGEKVDRIRVATLADFR